MTETTGSVSASTARPTSDPVPTEPRPEDKVTNDDEAAAKKKAAKKQAKKDAVSKKKSDDAKKAKSGNVLHTVSAQGGYELHLCEDGEWRTQDDLFNLTSEDN